MTGIASLERRHHPRPAQLPVPPAEEKAPPRLDTALEDNKISFMTTFSSQAAQNLHEDTFVFDFSPHGVPIPSTDRTRTKMKEALAFGGLSSALTALWNEHLNELESDESQRTQAARNWRKSGVDAVQVTLGAMELRLDDWQATLNDAARWLRRAAIGEDVAVCLSAADLRHAKNVGRTGILLGLQDTLQIGFDLSRLEILYALGVRVVQLTYNRRNLVGDGCTEPHGAGLSRFGVEVVRELNRLGIVVDVSHCGVATTNEAIQMSTAPVAVTHSACRALHDHQRSKTDEQLALLAENDGFFGVVAVPYFLGSERIGVEHIVNHLAHAAEILGDGRVGIATDWGFWTPDFPVELRAAATRALSIAGFRPEDRLELGLSVDGFGHWSEWPQITVALAERGFTDQQIRGFVGGNWLDFMERVQSAG